MDRKEQVPTQAQLESEFQHETIEGGEAMMEKIDRKLKKLGFYKTDELVKEDAVWEIIDYIVRVKDYCSSYDRPYGTELEFLIRKRDFEVCCYTHDYVYIVFVSPTEKESEEVIGKLEIFYDDWRNGEDERARLRIYTGEWIFVGNRLKTIEVMAKLFKVLFNENVDENTVEKVLFYY